MDEYRKEGKQGGLKHLSIYLHTFTERKKTNPEVRESLVSME